MVVVKSLRQLGMLLLLLVSFVAPSMVCAEPGARMSAQERACCRETPDQCGQMKMAMSESCCQWIPAGVKTNTADTKYRTSSAVALPPARLAAWDLIPPQVRTRAWADSVDQIFPESPPHLFSSLRI